MKKLIYTALAVALFSSCDVEVENPNSIGKKNFWETETDIAYGVNATYNMFYKPATYTRWMWFRLDLTSDEGFSQSPWAELKEWTQFRYNNYNFREGNNDTFHACYEAISRANQVLTYADNVTFSSETRKNELIGQAYFLRGLYYYHLALLWGSENKSVPIVLEIATAGMQPEGHTGEAVYNQAIADFTKAESMLPERWDDSNKGRATKGAALAYRAKVHMQMRNWSEAEKDLYWLVEGAGKQYYGLAGNYFDNFDKDTENNIESVFEIQYSDVNKAPAGDGDYDIDPNLGLNRGQFFAPPGVGWTDGELRPWLVDEFKKEKDNKGGYDIRLKYTAFYDQMHNDFENNDKIYHLRSTKEQWEQDNFKGRVFFRKYGTDYYRDYDDYHNPTNVRLIRFADVLLMYAEAIVENGGSLAKAVGYVDLVRARVDMPALATNHSAAASNKDAFLKRLQMERVMELATEGHRWADIKRWGLTDTEVGLAELRSRDADFDHFVIGKHNVLPIASDEVNNNKKISQNPKY